MTRPHEYCFTDMETSIRKNDFVLIICTPLYKLKSV